MTGPIPLPHQSYAKLTEATHGRLENAAKDARQNYEVQIALAASELRRAAGFLLHGKFLPMYELRADHPFVEVGNRSLKWWHDRDVRGSCDLSSLETARARYQRADLIDAKLAAPKLGEGITYLLEALLDSVKGEAHGRALQQAANAFDAARLREERCSPAYLYGALSQFLLLERQRESTSSDQEAAWKRQQITQRQAFYRLEHFIDQALEHILEDGPAAKRIKSARNDFEFYFDPDEIVPILQASREVIAALEERLELLPIVRAFAQADPRAILFSRNGSEVVADPRGTRRLDVVAGITFRAEQLLEDPGKEQERFRGARFTVPLETSSGDLAPSVSAASDRIPGSASAGSLARPGKKRMRRK